MGWRLFDVSRSQWTNPSVAAVRGHIVRGALLHGDADRIDFPGEAADGSKPAPSPPTGSFRSMPLKGRLHRFSTSLG